MDMDIDLEMWVPIIVAFVAGLLSFVPIWWRTRQGADEAEARTATTLTEGAAELVEKYEKLLDRLEKQVAAQDKKIALQDKKITALATRVHVLEGQLRELGETPRNGH
ncbi:hypothetical protein LCGC14_2987520 [marine sediment metagenome]|uniref:Uncharacterized protein n=1 Tax=marine sediment metagenome TaxID=412755 RepID=A0A0F8XSC4_9ZZZZ